MIIIFTSDQGTKNNYQNYQKSKKKLFKNSIDSKIVHLKMDKHSITKNVFWFAISILNDILFKCKCTVGNFTEI